jgi:hypothetical protein
VLKCFSNTICFADGKFFGQNFICLGIPVAVPEADRMLFRSAMEFLR